MMGFSKSRRRARPVGVGLAAVCVVAIAVSACSYDYAPIRVDVRDRASHEPIAGAVVRISNTHLLNPHPPRPAQGVTNDRGSVTLEVALYNNILVSVVATGRAEHIFSAEHPAKVGASNWFGPARTDGAAIPTMQIRLDPSGAELSEAAQPAPQNTPNDR